MQTMQTMQTMQAMQAMQAQQGGNAILCDVTKTARSYMTDIDIGDNNA